MYNIYICNSNTYSIRYSTLFCKFSAPNSNARVFNLSLKEGVVPFEWKEANIIPLFKKGSRREISKRITDQ